MSKSDGEDYEVIVLVGTNKDGGGQSGPQGQWD